MQVRLFPQHYTWEAAGSTQSPSHGGAQGSSKLCGSGSNTHSSPATHLGAQGLDIVLKGCVHPL